MEAEKRIELIIDFAKKVLQYPKGSQGYDPIDAINLQNHIEKYENESETRKSTINLTKAMKNKEFMWHFYLSVFRWFIKKNKQRAKVDDIVCVRFNSYRHKGKIAKVIETGYCEYDLDDKHCRDRDINCATLKFKDGSVAWNFQPTEYHIK